MCYDQSKGTANLSVSPGGCDFINFTCGFVAGKLGKTSASKHRRGSLGSAHKPLFYAIKQLGDSLRMTAFGLLKNISLDIQKTRALGMTKERGALSADSG